MLMYQLTGRRRQVERQTEITPTHGKETDRQKSNNTHAQGVPNTVQALTQHFVHAVQPVEDITFFNRQKAGE